MDLPKVGSRPNVLFYLVPRSKLSKKAAVHRENKHLLASHATGIVLEIGRMKSNDGPTTLATMGYGDVDLVLDDKSVSRVQCSFEVDPDTGVIMFVDRSSRRTSHFVGDNRCGFLPDAPRRVVVLPNVNTYLTLGYYKEIEFKLIWVEENPKEVLKMAKRLVNGDNRLHPRHPRDVGGDVTAKPSRPPSLTPSPWTARFRWTQIDRLGSGAFGTVWKGLSHHTGEIMAVKQLKKTQCSDPTEWDVVKREVELLSQIRHPHIVEFIGSSGWDTGNVEIFMDLKHGSLGSLMETEPQKLLFNLMDTIMCQMLKALDFLDFAGVVHRDLKPDNILYTYGKDRKFRFYLGDFGVSNFADLSTTQIGTTLFLAPECWERKTMKTPKVDVWALYVTILYMLNIEDFYNRARKCRSSQVVDLVLDIAAMRRKDCADRFYKMAALKPRDRLSAGEALEKYYKIRVDHRDCHRARPGPGPNQAQAQRPAQRNDHLSPGDGIDHLASKVNWLNLGTPDREKEWSKEWSKE